ncbi:unnamed protein product [Euphydryas editha]|uniref:Uncharacterized protein n=1 Tax=Euphydryas editha TaxID=104508 RepID=A0AAU9UQC5_EUPED|nr:unnamed protein product [Euphydryas editha]
MAEQKNCVANITLFLPIPFEIYKKLKTKLETEDNKSFFEIGAKLPLQEQNKFTPCADICDSTLIHLKDRERKQKALIAQLQANNQELLREVLALKEELILEGISDVKIK